MKLYNVTIKYSKLPWYEISGIKSQSKNTARALAHSQAIRECGNHPFSSIEVKIDRSS